MGLPKYILNQSYNATVFYFDNISFLAHVLNQLFFPNESSISQASYRTVVLIICFQDFKIQDLFKHLSGLKSKQHEVQLLQQLLHTCINKTKTQNEWERTILHFRSIFQTPNSRCPFHTQTHAHVRHGHPSTHAQSHDNIYE